MACVAVLSLPDACHFSFASATRSMDTLAGRSDFRNPVHCPCMTTLFTLDLATDDDRTHIIHRAIVVGLVRLFASTSERAR